MRDFIYTKDNNMLKHDDFSVHKTLFWEHTESVCIVKRMNFYGDRKHVPVIICRTI